MSKHAKLYCPFCFEYIKSIEGKLMLFLRLLYIALIPLTFRSVLSVSGKIVSISTYESLSLPEMCVSKIPQAILAVHPYIEKAMVIFTFLVGFNLVYFLAKPLELKYIVIEASSFTTIRRALLRRLLMLVALDVIFAFAGALSTAMTLHSFTCIREFTAVIKFSILAYVISLGLAVSIALLAISLAFDRVGGVAALFILIFLVQFYPLLVGDKFASPIDTPTLASWIIYRLESLKMGLKPCPPVITLLIIVAGFTAWIIRVVRIEIK